MFILFQLIYLKTSFTVPATKQ